MTRGLRSAHRLLAPLALLLGAALVLLGVAVTPADRWVTAAPSAPLGEGR